MIGLFVDLINFVALCFQLQSLFRYRTMNEADYGYLFCWAENIAGRQREPCRFEVVRESPPDPPIYCQPLNVTWEHIEATCQPGKVYLKTIRFNLEYQVKF